MTIMWKNYYVTLQLYKAFHSLLSLYLCCCLLFSAKTHKLYTYITCQTDTVYIIVKHLAAKVPDPCLSSWLDQKLLKENIGLKMIRQNRSNSNGFQKFQCCTSHIVWYQTAQDVWTLQCLNDIMFFVLCIVTLIFYEYKNICIYLNVFLTHVLQPVFFLFAVKNG